MLGLYDYGARWYDPALGRFLTPDTLIPDPGNPADWDRFAYTRGNPVKYTDPSGHFACGDGINDARCEYFDSSRDLQTSSPKQTETSDGSLLDVVPVVSDIRGILRGAQIMDWASSQSYFLNEQEKLQSWYSSCYGQCHYSESINPASSASLVGGPMPDTPLVDAYSKGAGEIANGISNLLLQSVTVKLSKVQTFVKSGMAWHVGLETSENMIIVHIGNHPKYGVHVALGSIKPFVADVHIYFEKVFPFFRIWRPK